MVNTCLYHSCVVWWGFTSALLTLQFDDKVPVHDNVMFMCVCQGKEHQCTWWYCRCGHVAFLSRHGDLFETPVTFNPYLELCGWSSPIVTESGFTLFSGGLNKVECAKGLQFPVFLSWKYNNSTEIYIRKFGDHTTLCNGILDSFGGFGMVWRHSSQEIHLFNIWFN